MTMMPMIRWFYDDDGTMIMMTRSTDHPAANNDDDDYHIMMMEILTTIGDPGPSAPSPQVHIGPTPLRGLRTVYTSWSSGQTRGLDQLNNILLVIIHTMFWQGDTVKCNKIPWDSLKGIRLRKSGTKSYAICVNSTANYIFHKGYA